MPRGQLRQRDPTLIQVLSLYLLLLAFFVILFNISKVEQFKTTVVTDSLNSAFNNSGQTTHTPAPLTSTRGRVIADHAFQRRIGQLIAAEIPIAEINEIKPGSVLEARVPVDILFENDDIAPARKPWPSNHSPAAPYTDDKRAHDPASHPTSCDETLRR